jgi:hypothetical protein
MMLMIDNIRLEEHFDAHDSLPKEAIIKADILRRGLNFDTDTLVDQGTNTVKHQPKSYFIFSFDMVTQKELGDVPKWRAPEEIALFAGKYKLERTIISVRLNPASIYRVRRVDDELWLYAGEEQLAQVYFRDMPAYYGKKLADGRPVAELAPSIEWGYLLYLTVFRMCQYFGKKEECQYCDINNNYRQQIKEKRPYTGIKSVEDILAALEVVQASDSSSYAYTLTGGSVTSNLQGKNEVEFYAQYIKAIQERFPKRWIAKIVAQAWPIKDVKTLKDAGAEIYHPNYEIWDPKLFAKFCPGKQRYIGRENWIRRIIDAAEVFEPKNIIPNFVAGIEMATPYGYTDVESAVRSTAEGLDFFMSKGIAPRFTTWCPEPMTPLGDTNPDGAPLEYHLRLLEEYRDKVNYYGLAPPPGYGEAGVGKAVFSVSPFMDVLSTSKE